jgi:hypothetical protein
MLALAATFASTFQWCRLSWTFPEVRSAQLLHILSILVLSFEVIDRPSCCAEWWSVGEFAVGRVVPWFEFNAKYSCLCYIQKYLSINMSHHVSSARLETSVPSPGWNGTNWHSLLKQQATCVALRLRQLRLCKVGWFGFLAFSCH